MFKSIKGQIEEMRKFMQDLGLEAHDFTAVPEDGLSLPSLIARFSGWEGFSAPSIQVAWGPPSIFINIILPLDEVTSTGEWFEISSVTALKAAKKIVRLFAEYCQEIDRHRRTQEDVSYAGKRLEKAKACDEDRPSQLAQVMPLIMIFYDARYQFPEARELLKNALELALLANSEIPAVSK